jgi:hypothetical protein
MVVNFRFHIAKLFFIILTLAGALAWILCSTKGSSAGPYLQSGHGNGSYGVSRTRTAGFGYAQGNCAHCHEQHASIEGTELGGDAPYNFALFYDDWITKCDLLCFQCHSAISEDQPVTNYPYSVNFGGQPTFYGTIKKQFCDDDSLYVNCGSRHNLREIFRFVRNNANGWDFSAAPDPCVACHPPHTAQRNHPVSVGGGKLNTAIRLPSHYTSRDSDKILWGDDGGERMSDYAASVAGTYQAPYYGNNPSSTYEPANDSTSDGSNLPDYVTFCLDCHQYAQEDEERGEAVKVIDWGSNGDRHGGYPANDCTSWLQAEGSVRAPYSESPNSNYVLSCLDCHEPHGTKNRLHLIRRMINGEDVSQVTKDPQGNCEHNDWLPMCDRCHTIDESHRNDDCCSCCHFHGAKDGGGSPGTGCRDKPIF